MKNFHLVPAPKSAKKGTGTWTAAKDGYISIDDRSLYECIAIARDAHFADCEIIIGTYKNKFPTVELKKAEGLKAEGYTLDITAEGVRITYADTRGAFYAFMTLNQIAENCKDRVFPQCSIEDWPSFPDRGYMLDISRNRIPKTEQILKLIDKLAALKVNQMGLYVEGIPFAYPSFPQMWEGRDVMRGEDILIIDRYCRERLIDLVPTQNNFGHMAAWLDKEFAHLAECPGGFVYPHTVHPIDFPALSLDPSDPGSFELVKQINADFLPYFSSSLYNCCCDETFELKLAIGKNKERCKTEGDGPIYLDFVKKVFALSRSYGKSPLFWHDVIIHHPDLLPEIDKDIVALNWGYSKIQPSEESSKLLNDSGVTHYVCPGVNGWNSFVTRYTEMYQNILNAGTVGTKHNARGLLNTDWGDNGQTCFSSFSNPGIVWGAAVAWGLEENRDLDLSAATDKHIYHDPTGCASEFVKRAGSYFEEEAVVAKDSVPLTFRFFIHGLRWNGWSVYDGITAESFDHVEEYLKALRPLVEKMDPQVEDGALIKREFSLNLETVILLQNAGRFYVARDAGDKEACRKALDALVEGIPHIINHFTELWLIRNRYAYLDKTLVNWQTMLREAKEELAAL